MNVEAPFAVQACRQLVCPCQLRVNLGAYARAPAKGSAAAAILACCGKVKALDGQGIGKSHPFVEAHFTMSRHGGAIKFAALAFITQGSVFHFGFKPQVIGAQFPQGELANVRFAFSGKCPHEAKIPRFALSLFFVLAAICLPSGLVAHVAVKINLRSGELESQGQLLAPVEADTAGNIVLIHLGAEL